MQIVEIKPTGTEGQGLTETSEGPITEDPDYDEQEQNQNAQFSFGYRIQDQIKDGFIERQEERNGLSLRGQYSYSDGYVRRTVTYEADENGYRVTNMEEEPINDGVGPRENEGGRAIVQMLVNGVETEYAIQRQAAEVGQTEHGEVDIEEVAEEEKEDVIKILK